MSARHTAAQDRDIRRLSELRPMLGTGQGIQRVPSKIKNVVQHISRMHGSPSPLVVSSARAVASGMRWVDGKSRFGLPIQLRPDDAPAMKEFFEGVDALPMEADMAHYRALAREARECEARLRRYVPGWIEPARYQPSPFGENRFRAFNPTPSYEFIAGPIRFIGR